jgi:hypothetical protein
VNRVPPFWVSALVLTAVLTAMAALETVRPLRRRLEPRLRRTVRNFTTGALSLAVVTLLQAPIVMPLVHWTQRNGVGLLNLVDLPAALEVGLAVLLLDYTGRRSTDPVQMTEPSSHPRLTRQDLAHSASRQ